MLAEMRRTPPNEPRNEDARPGPPGRFTVTFRLLGREPGSETDRVDVRGGVVDSGRDAPAGAGLISSRSGSDSPGTMLVPIDLIKSELRIIVRRHRTVSLDLGSNDFSLVN
jgi:hypothetical protein